MFKKESPQMFDVSVVVAVYNTKKYLRECLNSLANQNLNNLEIIVVNDGSTDGSLDIINEYVQCYNNFKVISQKNQGTGIARLTGLKEAKGKYIAFLDSDDFVRSDTYLTAFQYASEKQSDILEFNYYCYIDGTDIQTAEIHTKAYDFCPSRTSEEVLFLRFSNKVEAPLWFRLYSRNLVLRFLEKISEYDMTKLLSLHHEDKFYFPLFAALASRIDYIEEPLIYYRINDSSVMRQIRTNRSKYVNLLHEMIKAEAFWQDMNIDLSVDLKQVYASYFCQIICQYIIRVIKVENKWEYLQFIFKYFSAETLEHYCNSCFKSTFQNFYSKIIIKFFLFVMRWT